MVSKHTTIIIFGDIAENCIMSMMDPLGTKTNTSITTDDSIEESFTTGTPVENHDHSLLLPQKK